MLSVTQNALRGGVAVAAIRENAIAAGSFTPSLGTRIGMAIIGFIRSVINVVTSGAKND